MGQLTAKTGFVRWLVARISMISCHGWLSRSKRIIAKQCLAETYVLTALAHQHGYLIYLRTSFHHRAKVLF